MSLLLGPQSPTDQDCNHQSDDSGIKIETIRSCHWIFPLHYPPLSFPFVSVFCLFSLWYFKFFIEKKQNSYMPPYHCNQIVLNKPASCIHTSHSVLFHSNPPKDSIDKNSVICLKGRSEHQAWKKMILQHSFRKGRFRALQNLNLLMAYLPTIQLSVFTFSLMQLSSVVGDQRDLFCKCPTEAGSAYRPPFLVMNVVVEGMGKLISLRDWQEKFLREMLKAGI